MRTFDTGATRDSDETKLDFEGFLSPLVLVEFAKYMNMHRVQADGELRDSDNWQKGIPLDAYMKSNWRHFMDLWLWHRDYPDLARENIKQALCGILFNTQGYLHELLKAEYDETPRVSLMDRLESSVQESTGSPPPSCLVFDATPIEFTPDYKIGGTSSDE